MTYVEVAVDAPLGHGRTLTYSLPSSVPAAPGWLVWVPLLNRPVQGMVFAISQHSPVDNVKDVLGAVSPGPLLPLWRLELARWISDYYCSSLFEAVALMLPPGYRTRVRSFLHAKPDSNEVLGQLSGVAASLVRRATSNRGVPEGELVRAMGRDGTATVSSLVRKGSIVRLWEMPHPRVVAKYNCYLRPSSPSAAPEPTVPARSARQQQLWQTLVGCNDPMLLTEARKRFSASAVEGLLKAGLASLEWVKVERPADHGVVPAPEAPMVLTAAQQEALAQVTAALSTRDGGPRAFLLHGITGSGKTEVYLQALEACMASGQQGYYLVPEIAMTPQVVHRLNQRFPGQVAVMHSGLSPTALFDQWWSLHHNTANIVMGPRSALFAPLAMPGLIVIDEEHEWTYKQEDPQPRYHARQVALEMARLTGAVVLMGSATPDVETYYKASNGAYRLLPMPQRVPTAPALRQDEFGTLPHPHSNSPPSSGREQTPSPTIREGWDRVDMFHQHRVHRALAPPETEAGALPAIDVCDMAQELKEGHRGIFSRRLEACLRQCMEQGHQAILYLNRRGSASTVQCRQCSSVVRCASCSTPYSYHRVSQRLVCHYCGRSSPVPTRCRQCGNSQLRYLGLGVQSVAEEAARLLPGVSMVRWDSDAAPTPQDHQRILARFASGQARLLVGTQMVAKGLHVPGVALVGAVLADVGLNLPDFRAPERAFQLLSQVAGRAGRGPAPGRVIIQTYDPQHYAIVEASSQDYTSFYQKEMDYRRQQGNPPFGRLVRLLYQHLNAEACHKEAQRMARALRHGLATSGLVGIDIIGPAPAFPERVRGRHRWHIVLRGGDLSSLLERVVVPPDWKVDVDPAVMA